MFNHYPAQSAPCFTKQTWIIKCLWIILSLSALMLATKPAQATGHVIGTLTDPFSVDCASHQLVSTGAVGAFGCDPNTAAIKVLAAQYPLMNLTPYLSNAGVCTPNYIYGTGFTCPVFSAAHNVKFSVVVVWSPPVPTYSCPPNATLMTGGCMCNGNLIPDATATSCICPVGLAIDPVTQTCKPTSTYTIALTGLGGEVMPGMTRSAYAQVINSGDGLPKSGAQVALSLTVVPDTGTPTDPSNVGQLSPTSGLTGADGKLPFVFTAPSAGGTHTVHATCTNCTNEATDTITVPSCPIPPLTSPPFTDPVAAGFESGNRWRPDLLTPVYQDHLACVQNGITAAGGTYANGSAYRPTQYQQHLFEIVDKHSRLTEPGYMSQYPQCQALLNSVTEEMATHGLRRRQPVAPPGVSRHESGAAFDITPIGLTRAQMAPIYTSCGVGNTAVPGELWHVQ